MLYNLLVGALAFSAPPSQLSRRDMITGLGGAAAAMVPMAAFADASKYAGAADARKAAKAPPKDGPTPYEQLMAASKVNSPPVIAVPEGDFIGNGKLDGVTYRKSYDPNACSESCKKKRLAKYGYGA